MEPKREKIYLYGASELIVASIAARYKSSTSDTPYITDHLASHKKKSKSVKKK